MTTYIGITERENNIIVDGYTSAKTIRGICHDVGKVLIKNNICLDDAEYLKSVKTNDEAEECLMESKYDSEYFFEVEKVLCASEYNECTDEIEYKDGYNYYFCINVIK